jgi:glutathione synthase/RimK-type ligase-like ATP-grasp enzyme
MAAVSGEFVGVEPYIETSKDLRVLIFFEKVYGIERIGSQWKSNVCPKEMRIVDVPRELAEMSKKAAHRMGAEILGVDWIQNKKGEWLALESNLAPGLSFNHLDLRMEAIERLKNR